MGGDHVWVGLQVGTSKKAKMDKENSQIPHASPCILGVTLCSDHCMGFEPVLTIGMAIVDRDMMVIDGIYIYIYLYS